MPKSITKVAQYCILSVLKTVLYYIKNNLFLQKGMQYAAFFNPFRTLPGWMQCRHKLEKNRKRN